MAEHPPQGDTLRLFVAFDVPAAIREELATLQTAWQRGAGPASAAVKWVQVAGVHLTLKFLGAVPTAQVDLIRLALGEALSGARPLTVRLAAPGVFPSPQRPRVLWVGLANDLDALIALQQRVERALAALDFPLEGRFTPHFTLGRVREDAGAAQRQALGAALAALPRPSGATFALDVVHVMRSELRPSGARYTSLAEIRLAQGR